MADTSVSVTFNLESFCTSTQNTGDVSATLNIQEPQVTEEFTLSLPEDEPEQANEPFSGIIQTGTGGGYYDRRRSSSCQPRFLYTLIEEVEEDKRDHVIT